jgi:hypothetical protein
MRLYMIVRLALSLRRLSALRGVTHPVLVKLLAKDLPLIASAMAAAYLRRPLSDAMASAPEILNIYF